MKTQEKDKFVYDYKIELMESNNCFPVIFKDNSFKTVITVDEAVKILDRMMKKIDNS